MQKHVAVVSGAGNGLGYAIAARFASLGGRVAILDFNGAAAVGAAQAINSQHGGKEVAAPFACDVSDERQVNEAVDATARKFGAITSLISNAGIQHISSIVDLQHKEWRRILDVHLDGSFLLTKACMKHMAAQHREKRAGVPQSIILMGSVHSKLASKLKAPYTAAKHGLLGLTRAIAKEGAEHNIRSNLICPGYVLTDLVKKQIPEQAKIFGISEERVVKEIFLKDTVDGEFTTADDIADVAVFLATFKTNALTGQSINVSHGWHMD